MPRRLCSLCGLALLLSSFIGAFPARADWTDRTTGELRIGTQDALMTLVLPTGWVAFADDDRSGALSDQEIRAHAGELATRLGLRVKLTADGVPGVLSVAPPSVPPRRLDLVTDGRHAFLALHFAWPKPIGEVAIHYALFTPGVPGAMAELAVERDGVDVSLPFTPEHPEAVFDGRAPAHRVAMAAKLLGRARALEFLGLLFLLAGLGYGVWALVRGLRPRDGGEQNPHA